MRIAIVIAALAVVPSGIFAQSVDLVNPEFIARGSASYAKSCAVGYCHGSEGAAGRGPILRDREWDPRRLFGTIHDGLPGTSMPAWKGILPQEEIWAITAYIVSLGPKAPSQSVIELGETAEELPRELSAEAQRGHDLFFDLTNEKRCSICHKAGREGSANVGPNLAQSAKSKSAVKLRRAIVKPNADVAFGYATTEIQLRSGETVAGILLEKDDSRVRLFDFHTLPPALRSFYGDQVGSVRTRKRSVMPKGAELGYSKAAIDAVVKFLVELNE